MKWLWRLTLSLHLLSLYLSECNEDLFSQDRLALSSQGVVPKDDKDEEKSNLDSMLNTKAALEGMYKMSRGFVGLVGPKEEMLDEILLYVEGNKTVETAKDVLEILKAEAGFMTCLVLGLLLFLGLGIGGTFFCCCRCCCNGCGAKRVQNVKDNINTRRKTYFFLLFIVLVFMIVAVAMGYLVADKLNSSIPKTEENLNVVLDDVSLFLNNTYQELNNLGGEGLKGVAKEITNKLDDIGNLVGNPIKEACKPIKDIEKDAKMIDKRLNGMQDAKDLLKNITDALKEAEKEQNEIVKRLEVMERQCGNPCPGIATAPEIKTIKVTNLGDLPKTDKPLTAELKKATDQCDKIPETLKDKAEAEVKKVKKDINDFVDGFQKSSFQNTINDSYMIATRDIPKVKDDINKVFKDVDEHKSERWYGMAGVVSLLTIPTALLLLGMMCGMCGHRKSRHPADRGDLSHCGGCTIIIAVYLLFFITGIPILMTTITFQFGAHLETYVCSPLYQDNFATVDKIYEVVKRKVKIEGGFLEGLTPSTTLEDCRNGSTIYKAFKLENMFNISQLLDIESKLEIRKEIEKLDLNINERIKPFSDEIKNEVKKLNDSDFTKLEDLEQELQNNPVNLTLFDNWIHKLNETAQGQELNIKNELEKEIDTLLNMKETTLAPLAQDCENLKKKIENTQEIKDKGLTLEKVIDETLITMGTTVNKEKKKYAENLSNIATNYVKEVTGKVENDIGKCKQLWVIYDVTRKILCRDVLDLINGFWFSMGWALFFSVFAIAFGAKLSKHYLRMTRMKQRKWDEDTYARDISGQSTEALQEYPSPHRGYNDYEDYPPHGVPPPPYGPPQSPDRHNYGPQQGPDRRNYGPQQSPQRRNYGPPNPRQDREQRWSKY